MKIPCPTCKASTTWEENPHRPFCSERCRLIDLGKWASEEYRVPGDPVEGAGNADESEDGEEGSA